MFPEPRLGSEAMSPVQRSSFFVGGTYTGLADARVMHGQMFVEVLTPARSAHPYPLVLIHGAAQTGAGWLTTPDGRQGWAEWFAEHGWTVYLVDQPTCGRSARQPGIDGEPKAASVATIERLFTAPADAAAWPQAALHTQWPGGPGKGHEGDPVFDRFYAGQVPFVGNLESERLMQAAGAALLDRIGPAILLTHSQAGLFGWLIADARPGLVKGIVALEPAGPPNEDVVLKTGVDRTYGLTSQPLRYDPEVSCDAPLILEQAAAAGPGLLPCWAQKGTPRSLPNLAGVPVLVATSEASYHAMYDHCTARYLQQAGVAATFVRLADHGMRGNGHMMMLELNSLEIAAFLDHWMTGAVG